MPFVLDDFDSLTPGVKTYPGRLHLFAFGPKPTELHDFERHNVPRRGICCASDWCIKMADFGSQGPTPFRHISSRWMVELTEPVVARALQTIYPAIIMWLEDGAASG